MTAFLVISSLFLIVKTIKSNARPTTSLTQQDISITTMLKDWKFWQEQPNHLYVIDYGQMNDSEKLMIITLQGIVAQQKPEIFLDDPQTSTQTWLNHLKENYGISYEHQNNPWWYIKHFQEHLAGYILCDSGQDSINVATSLSGVLKAVVIDASLEQKAQELGLEMVLDARGKDEKWLKENYWNDFNHNLVIQLHESELDLRDISAAAKAFTFCDDDTSEFTKEVLRGTNDNSAVLGAWCGEPRVQISEIYNIFPEKIRGFIKPIGDTIALAIYNYLPIQNQLLNLESPEHAFTSLASQSNLYVIPTNHALNLSVFSAIPANPKQKTRSTEIKSGENVHYVTFIMSDGDNIQWLLNIFNDKRWYGSPVRGKFEMGWEMSPSMSVFAPAVLDWIYQHATENDYFVGGVSGAGYIYPDQYPDIQTFVKLTNELFVNSDLEFATVMLSNGAVDSSEICEVLTSQPHIKGVFVKYFDTSPNKRDRGTVKFFNGKPCVSARIALYEKTPEEVAAEINSLPRDSSNSLGYTFVTVEPWSHPLEDIEKVIGLLKPNTKVVSPKQFMQLMQQNLQ